MHSTTSLTAKLRSDFPEFTFTAHDEFHWEPETKSIYYIPGSRDLALLLHETAHGVLAHSSYRRDIELIKLESDAWDYTRKHLAPRYHIDIREDIVEDSLDTYRDWLHARSTCPGCATTGIEVQKNLYTCLACHAKWRSNEAKLCGLRRYVITK